MLANFASPKVSVAETREALVSAELQSEHQKREDRSCPVTLGSPPGPTEAIQVDNSPTFVSKAVGRWAYQNDVTFNFFSALASRAIRRRSCPSMAGCGKSALRRPPSNFLTTRRAKSRGGGGIATKAALTRHRVGSRPRKSPSRRTKRLQNINRRLTLRPNQNR